MSKGEFDGLKQRNHIMLSDGTFRKNPTGGEFVTKESFPQYLEFAVSEHLQESQQSVLLVLKGVQSVFDTKILSYFHWSQLQYCVIGEDKINLHQFKSLFRYTQNMVLQPCYDRFFNAMGRLNNFQLKQLSMLVFGRTRICSKFQPICNIIPAKFNDQNYIPVAKRNLLALYLPMYPT